MWETIAIGIVVICGANLFFGSILGFVGYLRYLKHKETIALAQAGIITAMPEQKPVANLRNVRSGIILMAIGMALCIGLYPIGWIADMNLPLNLGPWMLVGLIPLFIGMAQVLINYLPSIQSLVGEGVQKALVDSEANRQNAGESMPVKEVKEEEISSKMNV